MADDQQFISIWKVSARGSGDRHLNEGYPAADFPGCPGQTPDGCAYFAKDRWIAELFAAVSNYEDFLVEVRVPLIEYESRFQQFEHEIVFGIGKGVELAIPAEHLDELNRIGVRLRADVTEV